MAIPTETVAGLLFLSVSAWLIAAAVRWLLKRGIQIPYMVPMSPKEEDRMLRAIQRLSLVVLLIVGVYLAVRAV